MHVFFVTQWFPTDEKPYYGIFILEHARAVAQMHQVSLLHIKGVNPRLSKSVEITTQAAEPNLEIYHLSYRRNTIPFTTWTRELAGAKQVFDQCTRRAGQAEIIHANVWNTADVALYLARSADIPVVLSEHSSAYTRKLFSPLNERRMRFLMNRVDMILPVCDSLGKAIQAYGIKRPMVPVSNVVDTEIFYPAEGGSSAIGNDRQIALVARLDEEKAIYLAIQAMANLQQRGVYLHLQIVGDGPEEASLKSLTHELGLDDWVHFNGYRSKTDLAQLLRRSSLFLLTSLWESQPVVILEALACGIPVVAPAIGGIPEVVNGDCGMLFRRGDLADLTDKLSILLARYSEYNPERIRHYALESFSKPVISKQLDVLYQRVIDKYHVRRQKPDI